MPARTVEAPGTGQFLTTDEACAWLGISESTLDAISEQEEWFRPTRVGRKVLWQWLDVFVMGHIMARRKETSTGAAADENRKKS